MELLFEDNFNGSGTLPAHTSDTGRDWVDYSSGGQISLSGGYAQRPTGYSTANAVVGVEGSFYVAGEVSLTANFDVAPESATGDSGFLIFVSGIGDDVLQMDVTIGNQGYCLVNAGAPTGSVVLSPGSEPGVRNHTVRIRGTGAFRRLGRHQTR